MKHNKENKNLRYTLAVVLALVIIGVIVYANVDWSKDSAASTTRGGTQAAPVEQRVPTAVNQDLIDTEIDFEAEGLPYVVEVEFGDARAYSVVFELDEPLQVTVLNEQNYQQWQSTGDYLRVKQTTRKTIGTTRTCCSAQESLNFQVNNGEGGKYYIVFDDDALGVNEPRPTVGKLRITWNSEI